MGDRGSDDAGWFGFWKDDEGRIPVQGNEHLTVKQRAQAERDMRERAERRGRLQVRVVVDVYENGETDPQVQFPHGSSVAMTSKADVKRAVGHAAEALRKWR